MSILYRIQNLLIALIVFCCILEINAQEDPPKFYRCYTMEHFKEVYGGSLKELPAEALSEWYKKHQKEQTANGNPQNRSSLYTIPIVFHIVHNGDPIGTGDNLAKIYIDEQIIQLNNDMRRVPGSSGHNNHPDGADTEIQFCPAAADVNGTQLFEFAINRINRNSRGWSAPPYSTNYVDNTIKPNSIWDPNQYFNVWVLQMNGGILGYAQFPTSSLPGMPSGSQDADTDGCVVATGTVGSTDLPNPNGSTAYDNGRTLSHEVGHWLGLRHIWGDGGCSVDDYCDDTPGSDAPNYGCPVETSCGSLDMVENYMDYTDDGCMNIFTIDQKYRMQFVMGETGNGSPRREILQFSNKCDTDPYISFSAASSSTIEGTSSCVTAGSHTQTIDMIIAAAPTAPATVTLSLAGSAILNTDYNISPSILTFPAGSTASQMITITVLEDAYQESDETVELSFTVNANGGDALAGANNQIHTLTLTNDDYNPEIANMATQIFFTENFTTNSWTQTSSGTNKFTYGTLPGIGGRSPYISENNNAYTYANNTSNARLVSPPINASLYSGITVDFDYRSDGERSAGGTYYDYGRFEYSTDGTNFIAVGPYLQDENNTTHESFALPASVDNAAVLYLAFRWINDNSVRDQPPLAFDNVELSGDSRVPAAVQTTVNSTSGFTEHEVGPFETVHFYDLNTGDIMLSIINQSAHNYGCTKVEVDREGSGATAANAPGVGDVADKTFLVSPEFNNPVGNYTIRVYYTEAEVNGWVSGNVNGNPISSLKLIKSSGPVSSASTMEVAASTSRSAYNSIHHFFEAGFNTGFSGFTIGDEGISVLVNAKIFLNGPYSSVLSRMHDSLRVSGYIPLIEPFNDLGFTHVGGGNEVITNPAVLLTSGANAIVDWIFLELRDPADSTVILGTRSALIKRNGNIVETDGISYVHFSSLSPGSYYLVIRHRNHLGVMTATSLNFDNTGSNQYDFTSSSFQTYGTHAMKDLNGTMVMWAGNGNLDNKIVFAGSGTDINPISIAVYTNPLNINFLPNFPRYGYEIADYNMDGKVVFAGSGTDVNSVSISVYTNPANINFLPTFPVTEQLPQ